MTRFRSIKNSLIGGEISPTATGRTDLPSYAHSCKKLQNMIPLQSGGAYRRPGTFYQTQLAYASYYPPAMYSFIYSEEEAYSIIVTMANPGATPTIKPLRSSGSTYTVGTCTGSHPWQPSQPSDVSPIEWQQLQTAQSGDVMYMVHPNRMPQKLSRTLQDTFTIANYDSTFTGTTYREGRPYFDQNTTTINMYIDTATVGSPRTLKTDAAFFNQGHADAVFKVLVLGVYGCFKATAFVSDTELTGEVIVAFGAAGVGNKVATWWESSWSTYRGFPRSVTFFENRLVFAGAEASPDSIWFSQQNKYDVFSVDTITLPRSAPTGVQPFTFELSSNQLNLTQWVYGDRVLFLGTSLTEWVIENPDPTSAIQCTNISAKQQTAYGSEYLPLVRAGNEVCFSSRGDFRIKSLVFNDVEKSYFADPIQLLFDEFPHDPVNTPAPRQMLKMQWDQYRNTLWCLDSDGHLVCVGRDRALKISAWSTHVFGGYNSTETSEDEYVSAGYDPGLYQPAYTNCSGSVISFCIIPNELGLGDDVQVCIKRKINGAFQYQFERLTGTSMLPDSAYNTIGGSAFNGRNYADASKAFSGTSTSSFTGMSHLEGKSLTGTGLNTNGMFKVTGGAVSSGSSAIVLKPGGWSTLSTAYYMGLSFDSIVETVRIEAGSQIGSSQGAIKRIHEVAVRLYKTLYMKIGRDASHLESHNFRTTGLNNALSPEFFTGDVVKPLESDYDRDGTIYILCDNPLPFTVLAVIATGQTYD